MELLLEITNSDIGELEVEAECRKRDAARAVILDRGRIAILHVTKGGYYKLPGGGLEEGESIEEALEREVMEETGCRIRVICDLGSIIEKRKSICMIQTSYCFLTEVAEHVSEPNFMEDELEDGFELVWMDLDSAVRAIENGKSSRYNEKFVILRDTAFMKRAKNMIRQKGLI
jgi:8-oxo-dGTP diphosphatase